MENLDQACARFCDYFARLTPESLTHLETVYLPTARFKDSFGEVSGSEAIRAVYARMFAQLDQPRFEIHSRVAQGQEIFLTWDFHFQRRHPRDRRTYTMRGASHLQLVAQEGQWRIASHRDYCDVAEELYEKIPLLGSLMRALKRAFGGA